MKITRTVLEMGETSNCFFLFDCLIAFSLLGSCNFEFSFINTFETYSLYSSSLDEIKL